MLTREEIEYTWKLLNQVFQEVPYTINIINFKKVFDQAADLKSENEILRKALEQIAYPMTHLKEEADKTGCQVDWQMAIELSNNATYLSNIAKEVLNVTVDVLYCKKGEQ